MFGTPRQSLVFAAVVRRDTAGNQLGTPVFWWLLVTAAIGGQSPAHAPPSSWLAITSSDLGDGRSEIKDRAELQNRWWVLEGDNRGVYGTTGAALMRHLASAGSQIPRNRAAAVAYTADELENCWKTSFQLALRHSFPLWCNVKAVSARLLDVEIGTPHAPVPVYGLSIYTRSSIACCRKWPRTWRRWRP